MLLVFSVDGKSKPNRRRGASRSPTVQACLFLISGADWFHQSAFARERALMRDAFLAELPDISCGGSTAAMCDPFSNRDGA